MESTKIISSPKAKARENDEIEVRAAADKKDRLRLVQTWAFSDTDTSEGSNKQRARLIPREERTELNYRCAQSKSLLSRTTRFAKCSTYICFKDHYAKTTLNSHAFFNYHHVNRPRSNARIAHHHERGWIRVHLLPALHWQHNRIKLRWKLTNSRVSETRGTRRWVYRKREALQRVRKHYTGYPFFGVV